MMKDLVLVDTSVFIDYLRGGKDDTLSILILNNQVLLSPVVRLELLAGVRRKELSQLERILNSLIPIEKFRSVLEYEKILFKAKSSGLIGGLPDLFILADTIYSKAILFSIDEKMLNLANKLRIKTLEIK